MNSIRNNLEVGGLASDCSYTMDRPVGISCPVGSAGGEGQPPVWDRQTGLIWCFKKMSENYYLVIRAGISQDQQAGLLEGVLDLVSEGTRGVAASDRLAASVLSELEHRALAVRASGLHHNVLRVLNSDNHASSHHKLVPGLGQVDDVDACSTRLLLGGLGKT